MFRNMANSLFRHELIKTTLPKAKELRRVAEPLITMAKTDSVHKRRVAFARLRDKEVVGKLFNDLVERGKGVEVRLAERVERAGSSLRGTVKDVQKRAGKTLKSIEVAVDEQVGAALGKIGVPTRDEVAALRRRIENLTRSVTGGKKKTAKRKTTKKKTAKKRPKKKAAKKAR